MKTLTRFMFARPAVFAAALVLWCEGGQAFAAGEGHGGAIPHGGVAYGGRGYYGGHGYGGYGYGGRGYYGGWGWGWGGVGLGFGYGYYGYPYYGYPYYGGYPAGYPDYGPAGYPYAAYSGATPPPVPPAGGPVGPVASPGSAASALNISIPPIPGQAIDTDVTLIIRSNPDATIWINGVKTTQTGARREFTSSGLTPGRTYTFDVRAQWGGADGRALDLHRRVPVQAGERRSIDFTQPPVAEAAVVEIPAGPKP
jgi:uncharacterized protein (TIGR03000 family)